MVTSTALAQQLRCVIWGANRPAPLPIKIAAGMTTGALAIMVASPTDLVKVRLTPATLLLSKLPSSPIFENFSSAPPLLPSLRPRAPRAAGRALWVVTDSPGTERRDETAAGQDAIRG